MRRTLAEIYTEAEMVALLQRRGYIVRHQEESRCRVSWHHVEPVPDDFEARALEELRKQITPAHIQFITTPKEEGVSVRSAYLRIL